MKKNKSVFRTAFSMLELVFVIVILGIVASIGAELIAKVYENYIVQRGLHRSSIKTELVATQIANRLAYAIPDTIVGRLNPATFQSINNIPAKTYNTLQWIAYDADSFGAIKDTTAAGRRPGWSGFCDVRDPVNTTATQISTPGSDLSLAHTIIGKLSGGTKSVGNTGLFFPGTYNVYTVGFSGSDANAPGASKVNAVAAGTVIPLAATVGGVPRTVKEHYKLAWTAYAIVPTQITGSALTDRGFDSGDEIYDLDLHYNFQPWDSIYYNNANTKIMPLIRNVSVFNFVGTGSTIRFKLCVRENTGGTHTITTCKEKAVVR